MYRGRNSNKFPGVMVTRAVTNLEMPHQANSINRGILHISATMIALLFGPVVAAALGPAALRGCNQGLNGATPPQPLALKQALVALSRSTDGGARATDADAAEAADLIKLLESAAGPASSWADRAGQIEGAWDQVYTDNPQAGTVWSDGRRSRRRLLGPLSGRVQQVITVDAELLHFAYAQRATARLFLGLQAEMRANVEAEPDGVTWKVAFEDFGWSLLGGRVPLRRRKLPPGSGGVWRTTYLDADTRILRTQSSRGGPPTVYVLRRS